MLDRRELLTHGLTVAGLLAAAGLWPTAALARWDPAAFEARNLAEVMKALGVALPTESKEVTLTAPEIAENGAVVPVAAATTLPGAKRLLILVEKNPATLSAVFELSDAVDANVATRVKMNQSSNVYAVAMMADGRVLFAQKDVKVTLGGCGG